MALAFMLTQFSIAPSNRGPHVSEGHILYQPHSSEYCVSRLREELENVPPKCPVTFRADLYIDIADHSDVPVRDMTLHYFDSRQVRVASTLEPDSELENDDFRITLIRGPVPDMVRTALTAEFLLEQMSGSDGKELIQVVWIDSQDSIRNMLDDAHFGSSIVGEKLVLQNLSPTGAFGVEIELSQPIPRPRK